LGVTALMAAAPVAQVIGSEPLRVDGIAAPARNAVPVALGGEVATGRGVGVVQFRDGSNVTLQPNSVLRVEGEANKLVVRVVQGTATYDLAPSSRISMQNSRGETINQVLDAALRTTTQMGGGSTLTDPLATVAITHAARQPGMVLPTVSSITGRFMATGGPAAGTSGSAQVILPNGLILNLTASTNPTTGVVTYTVTSVQQQVTTPTGTSVLITSTTNATGTSSVIGATVSGVSGITGTNTQVSITLTPAPTAGNPNPAPLTPAQTQAAAQADVNAAVQTAVTNGTLPAGTQAPVESPVSTGKFSASGS
jgi:hypothetical protein